MLGDCWDWGLACQRYEKCSLERILVLGSWPLWVLARCLGSNAVITTWGMVGRSLRYGAVYAYLAHGKAGVRPYSTQLTNGKNWRDVSWGQSKAEESREKRVERSGLKLGL